MYDKHKILNQFYEKADNDIKILSTVVQNYLDNTSYKKYYGGKLGEKHEAIMRKYDNLLSKLYGKKKVILAIGSEFDNQDFAVAEKYLECNNESQILDDDFKKTFDLDEIIQNVLDEPLPF